MPSPSVSVIIPLYNCPQFIAEAVQSILHQTVPPLEIIVVDDGSTDQSIAAVPAHPKVKVIARPHAGLAATLNHGIACAQGTILAFLDNDDRWISTKLEKQLARLQTTSEDELVFCLARIFHEGPTTAQDDRIASGIAKSALLLKRSVFDRIGPFPTGKDAHDFLGWYARAKALNIPTHVIPEVLFERRIHGNNDGILNRDRQRSDYFATLKTLLDQRRKNQSGPPPQK